MRAGGTRAANLPDPLEWNAMDYPNLLENAFDEAVPGASAVPAAGDAAGDSVGAPQLLIWRQIRWSNRRPLIEVEPVVPGGATEGALNSAPQTTSHTAGESTLAIGAGLPPRAGYDPRFR